MNWVLDAPGGDALLAEEGEAVGRAPLAEPADGAEPAAGPLAGDDLAARGWLRQVTRRQPGPIRVKSISAGWMP